MVPISKERAMEILQPFIEKIRLSVVSAVNGYFKGPDYAKTRHKHSPRTAASICHDDIIEEIKKNFEGVSGAYHKTVKGLFMLTIKDSIVLRFKKFKNKEKLISNGIPTQQALAFNLQDPTQLEFEDMPPDGLLHVGYVINSLGTAIDSIHVTYRFNKYNLWTWNITTANMEVAEQIIFPQTATTTRKRKVTARGKNTGTGDNNAINN